MSKSLIPLRPKDFSTPLSQPEQSCLTWFVISGCTRKEAFITFARPDMLNSRAKAAIDDYVKQFFSQKDVKDYIEAYETTLKEFINPTPKKSDAPADTETIEEKKTRALTKLVEYVLTEADNINAADDPKAILDYANKIGVFDMGEKVEELPRRYLPESCSGCEYRKFVEENCEKVDDGTDFEGS